MVLLLGISICPEAAMVAPTFVFFPTGCVASSNLRDLQLGLVRRTTKVEPRPIACRRATAHSGAPPAIKTQANGTR